MTVLYFGLAREVVSINEEVIEIADELTMSELWSLLVQRHPQLDGIRKVCRIALDGSYASDDHMVGKHAEVAVIPPVAGG